jgi:hypothetical protein
MRSTAFVIFMIGWTHGACAQEPTADEPKATPGKPILAVDHAGHAGRIADFDFTPDGRKLFTLGHDNTIQIWDAVTREFQKTLALPWKIHPNGELTGYVQYFSKIAVASDGKTIALVLNGTPPPPPPPKKSDDDRIMGQYAFELYLVHVETGRMQRLLSEKGPVVGLTFSSDGDMLACMHGPLGGTQAIKIWHELKRFGEPAFPVPAVWKEWKHPHVHDLQFAPDNSMLATAGFSDRLAGSLVLWDLAKPIPEPQKTLSPKEFFGLSAVVWGGQGTRLAVDGPLHGPKDRFGKATAWAVENRDLLQLRSATYDLFEFDNRRDGAPMRRFDFRVPRPVFTGENELLVVAAVHGEKNVPAVFRLDVKKKTIAEFVRFELPPKLHSMKIAPGGQRLATLSGNGQNQVAVLELQADGKLQRLQANGRPAPQIAFSKKGYRLAWTGNEPARLAAGVDLGGEVVEAMDSADLKLEDFGAPATSATSGKYRAVRRFGKGGLFNIMRDGRVLLTVFASGQEWVVCTPEGYYAASQGGEKMVGWHVNNGQGKLPSFYPLERFRKNLYRPDVIALVLERGSVATALKVANALRGKDVAPTELDDQLPAHAALAIVDQSKLPEVKVSVKAEASKGQLITALRLLVDGRPLPDGAAHEKFAEGKKVAQIEWAVTLPPGKHQLAALVRCPDSSALSNAIEASVADPSKQNTLHVLSIGINDYEDSTLKLEFAAKDAQEIAANFEKCCKGELFQNVNSVVLADAKARKQAILDHVGELRKKAKSNDLAVVYFAGHGVKLKDKFYLLNVEAKTDDLAKTAISGNELRKSLGEFPCQVLLILDACHSSAGLRNFRPAVDDITRQMTDDECGVAVLCAAMGHEKALEKGGNGLFTRAIVDGLNRKDGVPFNTSNRLFYVHHLHAYVFDQVSEQSAGKQHPFLSLPWVVESFPVAKFAAK